MRISWRRTALAVTVCLSTMVGGVAAVGTAHAQPVQFGTLSFTGDPGDYISGGQSYSYATESGDDLGVFASGDGRSLRVGVNAANGDWWDLSLAAPLGQALTVGSYPEAHRFPFQGAGPGLDLSGNGRGCNTLTGSFEISDISFGPHGYVERLEATYEQHCEGSEPALRGKVHIANPPAPPELGLDLAVATDGTASTVSGNATAHGTVSCNKATDVTLAGTVRQVVRRVVVKGDFSVQVRCTPDQPAGWTATAIPSGDRPFQKGGAEVTTRATGFDSDYGSPVTVEDITVVTLRKS